MDEPFFTPDFDPPCPGCGEPLSGHPNIEQKLVRMYQGLVDRAVHGLGLPEEVARRTVLLGMRTLFAGGRGNVVVVANMSTRWYFTVKLSEERGDLQVSPLRYGGDDLIAHAAKGEGLEGDYKGADMVARKLSAPKFPLPSWILVPGDPLTPRTSPNTALLN